MGVVALAAVLLSVVWTWPLATKLTSRVAHDPGDPILNTWILWWNAQAVPFTARWWNAPFFFPMRDALALSEHLAGLSPFSTPLLLAGVHPLGAYNTVLILTFALSAIAAYLLVRRLTGSMLAASCAGLAYGFSPYRASQLGHLQVLASFWMPIVLLAMHGYLDTRRGRWLLVFAAAWLLQALSNGYYLLFLPVLITLWLLWFVPWRRAPAPGVHVVVVWIASSLLLVPVLLKYRTVHASLGLFRTIEESRRFSASLASFVHGSPLLPLWPSHAAAHTEDWLFPGVVPLATVLVAGVIALVRDRAAIASAWRDRSPLLFYAVAAVIMWWLAFGPAPEDAGIAALAYPYTLLSKLPGFEGLRVPARFAMLGVLCIGVACGLAVAYVRGVMPRESAKAAAGIVVSLLLVEGWMTSMPLVAPPSRAILPDVPDAVVVELPPEAPDVGVWSMYRSMFHGRPVVSGYSGHLPRHTLHIAMALHHGDPSPLTFLAQQRPLIIVIDERQDPGGRLETLVRELPGIQTRASTGAGRIYVLPRMAPQRVAEPGAELPALLQWNLDRIDLGEVRVVRTIGFPMRHRFLSLSTRMAFQTSLDGVTWTTVWEDWTGAPAVAAVLRDAVMAPVRITLPDVPARYLRFAPGPDWLWKEIRFYGP